MMGAIMVLMVPLYERAVSFDRGWRMAIGATVLLALSVVLHELGHALAARRYRLTVRSITLFGLGGIAETNDEADDPIHELLIAFAGPLMNLLVAFLGAAGWFLLDRYDLRILALHLAIANLLLLVFNLLPGYPMDGGRVLRAVLWFLTDEELYAARAALTVGRVSGFILVAIGVLYAFAYNDPLIGIWVALLGYFVNRAAADSYGQLLLRHTLNGLFVSDMMQRIYRAVSPELRLDQFVGRYVLGQTDHGFPVLPEPVGERPQPLLGMMTLRNLRRFGLHQWTRTSVREAMTPAHRLPVLAPTTPARDAFQALIESGEEQLPVIENDALLGMLYRRDVVRRIQLALARGYKRS